jgi:hypothetical protein
MRSAVIFSLIAVWFVSSLFAADWRQFTKSSREELHIERELLDFFDRLRESDPEGKRSFAEALRPVSVPAKMQLDTVRVPQVALWYPSHQKIGSGGVQRADSTYLLILPVGGTRETEEEVSACLIGEFHVVYQSERRQSALLTNSLNITFRGFRLSRGGAIGP